MSLSKLTMKKEFVFTQQFRTHEKYTREDGTIGYRYIPMEQRARPEIKAEDVHLRTSQK